MMASAPIIIPILILIVALVAIILSIYKLIQKLFGCPHQKSSYPFDEENFDEQKHRSVLPSNPYSIDPSTTPSNNSTASPNSVYYKGAVLLYPALAAASAPSRSPSPRDSDDDDNNRRNKNKPKEETIGLDSVDHRIIDSFSDTPSPNSSNTTREDNQNLLTVHSTDSSSPEHLNNFDNRENNQWNGSHFESDV